MDVLALTRYDRLGASSRVRTFQYLAYLREHNCDVTEAPLFDSDYLRALYRGGRRRMAPVLGAYTRRIKQLLARADYDLLWFEKELLPWIPYGLEAVFLSRRTPYVVDFDDAVFHRYDRHPLMLVRSALGNKLARVMRGAESVMVGSHYLADYAREAGAARVEFVPTVVDLAGYRPREGQPAGRRIGWIGTPMTAREYLPTVSAALQRLARERDFTLVLIGAGDIELPGVRLEHHEWSPDTEAGLIATLDVGIMPLTDGPWERGKCGYKLIQYMACGVPVVASDVGENPYIVHHGEHGFLARTERDWVEGLASLLDSPDRARAMGQAARRRVEGQFCTAVTSPRLLAVLREAAGTT